MIARMPVFWPIAATAAFAVLLMLTVGGWAPLDAADAAAVSWFRGYGVARPQLIAVVRIATDVAATWVFVSVGVVAAGILAGRRRWAAAGFITAVTVAVPVLWAVMHWVLPHARPVGGFVTALHNGFPSGHTANASALALTVGFLLWPRLRGRGRAVMVLVAAAFALLVGLSRVVLLAHWPADVVGGWLLALAVVPPLARLAARLSGSDG